MRLRSIEVLHRWMEELDLLEFLEDVSWVIQEASSVQTEPWVVQAFKPLCEVQSQESQKGLNKQPSINITFYLKHSKDFQSN